MNSAKCEYINPEILEWARISAGYSLDSVTRTFKNISKWEKGEDFPTYKQLESLSEKYKVPLAIFFFENIPEDISVKKSFRTLPQYEIDNLNPELTKILKKAQFMQMNLVELNNNRNHASKNIVKDFNLTINNLCRKISEIREYISVSLQNQFDTKDADEFFKLLREAFVNVGIFVFKDAFKNSNVSGFCLYDDEFPVIYVNNSQPKTRQVFTLFHELAHLLLKNNHMEFEDISYLEDLNNINKNIEIICNKFAGEFLVPFTELKKYITKNNINDDLIKSIANVFSVSQDVILRRLLDNNLISNSNYKEKIQILNQLYKKNKENNNSSGNFYNTQIAYLGTHYLNIVFEKYNANIISFENALEYTGLNAKSFNKLENYYYGLRRL